MITEEDRKEREAQLREFGHGLWEDTEFEFMPPNYMPSIQEEVDRRQAGWVMGSVPGATGRRHWARNKPKTCESCCYFVPLAAAGHCHRHASVNVGHYDGWPSTFPFRWCGDYERAVK